jgi:hypothetical protein
MGFKMGIFEGLDPWDKVSNAHLQNQILIVVSAI